MQGLVYCILFLSISGALTALLDGECNTQNQCEGANVVCRNGKCQCDTPLYTSCNSTCELNRRVAYEGDRCIVDEHCVENSRCSEQKCVCLQDYRAKSGLCYKTLNTTCMNNTECWSNYCINGRCGCPVGYEVDSENVGCRRRLVKIYRTWEEARNNDAFCADSSSCFDPIAECFNDTKNPSNKFCKCPQGFRVTEDNERCELVESPYFSPLTEPVSDYGECGTCKDSNAVCMTAAGARTCWCRAGYRKENDQCVSDRFQPTVIFPNDDDRRKYDYRRNCGTTFNGSAIIADGVCTCAPGYRFVAKDRRCQPIEPEWINDVFEYGLCTRIDSSANISPENGLCPSPLTCQARRDKYVCSCGEKKFRDVHDSTKCVYFIGERANNTNDLCPTKNAEKGSDGVCRCLPGYQVTNNRRECEVRLSNELFNNTSCNTSAANNPICTDRYGERSRLCSPGECRCDGVQSFPDANRTRCYAPVNVSLTQQPFAQCPPLSTLTGSLCRCNIGYHTTDQRTCVPLPAQLSNYLGTPSNTPPVRLTDDDCRALFAGPVQRFNETYCQCISTALVGPETDVCWYKLNVSLANPASTSFCPPNSVRGETDYCKCEPGYVQEQNQCVLLNIQVYPFNATSAVNTPGLTNAACEKLFSPAAKLSSQGSFCECRSGAFPVRSNTGCQFEIDFNSTDVKTPARCPDNAEVSQQGTYYTCSCRPGYRPSADRRSCELSTVSLVGLRDRSDAATLNCTSFSEVDCQVKFGSDAFCFQNQCYCDRKTSYLNADRRCESFANYIFPGLHEYQRHTCETDKDCGDEETTNCESTGFTGGHKICRCAKGAFLDPKSGKCVGNLCEPACNTANNFECREGSCVCKPGYIASGNTCVENNYKLELDQRCNASASFAAIVEAATNDYLVCDPRCSRARCIPGYRPDDDRCVRYKLEDDSCVYRDSICSTITANAFCNRDTNRCSCRPSFYQAGEQCARAVNSRCVNDVDCGGNMRCEAQRCQCNADQRVEDAEDVFGRPIQRCINNGVDSLKFSLFMIAVAMLYQFFFI